MSSSFLQELRPGGLGTRLVQRLSKEGRIGGGLFAGMRYISESVCGTNPPKLLGVYEIELRPVFEQLTETLFDEIIDIGAAEGYYAVGCARLWGETPVLAYEASNEGRELLEKVVSLNGVGKQVDVRGYCSVDELRCITSREARRLLIMDVEGAEGQLLDMDRIPTLANCHIMVEIHDWVDPTMGDTIRDRFSRSHCVKEIWSRKRRFADFEVPSNPILRWYMLRSLLAFSHERPCRMRWFYMAPLDRSPNPACTN